jgi:alpha-methylacyl-CoA racemase
MLLALGITAALFERERSGKGQVIDSAMVDGAALMLTPFYAARASGFWQDRGTNLLDTGAPFYEVYECADGEWIAVGAIEPQFYAELLDVLGLDPEELPDRDDRASWPALKERFASVFATRTRDEWCARAEGRDACIAPVLELLEAASHPHNVARGTFLQLGGVPQPAPAPRFSRTPAEHPRTPQHPGTATAKTLADWGFETDEVAKLVRTGVLV